MSDERHHGVVDLLSQHCVIHVPASRPLKRKRGQPAPTVRTVRQGYPSPPMSNPPSPTRPSIARSLSTAGESSYATTAALPTTSAPFTATTTSSILPFQALTQVTGSTIAPPLTQTSSSSNVGPASSGSVDLASGQNVFTVGQLSTVGSSIDDSAATRSGRKSKAHVASACMNCKRAHLSCDVQRPCARCVASSKQVGQAV